MGEQWRNGVPHGAEVPYAFATLGAGPMPGPAPTPEDQAVARMVNTYWANFARAGDPNGPGLSQWGVSFASTAGAIFRLSFRSSSGFAPSPAARLDVTE